jgi:hypothetical protein
MTASAMYAQPEAILPKKLHENGPAMPKQSMSDEAISAYVRAANVTVATHPSSEDHSNLHDLTDYMKKRETVGADKAGPPPKPR